MGGHTLACMTILKSMSTGKAPADSAKATEAASLEAVWICRAGGFRVADARMLRQILTELKLLFFVFKTWTTAPVRLPQAPFQPKRLHGKQDSFFILCAVHLHVHFECAATIL